MTRTLTGWIALTSLAIACNFANAQTPLGTAFTYQGKLNLSGSPVSATADFQFKLFGVATGGSQIGTTQSVNNVAVAGGLFTVSIDFGAAAFDGDARFLEIAVRVPAGGGAFTTLTPRQALNATPYALKARGIDGHSLDAADGSPIDALVVDNGGNVGINTTTPLNRLHVTSAAIGDGIRLSGTGNNSPGLHLFDGVTQRGTLALALQNSHYSSQAAAGDVVLRSDTGRLLLQNGLLGAAMTISGNQVGIGTTAPLAKLHVDSGDLYLGLPTNGFFFHTRSSFGGDFMHITDTVNGVPQFQRGFALTKAGNIGIGTAAPAAKLDVIGTTRTTVLEITGADLAEKFPTSDKVEPGMVVAIDRERAGKLCLARGAYNKCVAGVVSGANNFSAGAILGNLPGHDDAPPVALSGRVYVHCDAAQAAIEPGDLLTSSDTPGHAMKVIDPARADNAIIGKAMSRLPKGDKGLVLVLVNLH